MGESIVTIEYSLEKNQTSTPLTPQETKNRNRKNISLEFIVTKSTEMKIIESETNENQTEEINEIYWIVGEWSKTCRNPCSSNQTRSVKCSADHIKCDKATKPIESRPCAIQNDLICKSKVNSLFNKVIQYLEELFKSENLIE